MSSVFENTKSARKSSKLKGIQTIADWLRYYNDLDVAPGLGALKKMRASYTDKGIDILKDAVSLPEVNLHYLLRSTIEQGAELYSPCKEASAMLQEAVVGGQSPVLKRYNEAGVTRTGLKNQEFVRKLSAATPTRST